MQKEWFAAWFDSPFYHLLYKNHDEAEARRMLDNLLSALNLPSGARVLDLACGKGRHSRYLAEKGFEVTGLDISSASITYARQFEHERLAFFQHDMRKPFRVNYFDAVVNIFTSFGYFDNDTDHLRTLQNIARNLKSGGRLLLDYFNSQYVRDHLVAAEDKKVEEILFHIHRRADERFVYKTVEFQQNGTEYYFTEQVRLFTVHDFQSLLAQAGLWVEQLYGGYDLSPFDQQHSARLVLIAEKK